MVNRSHTPDSQSEAGAVSFLRFLWRPSASQVAIASPAPPEHVLSQLQDALAASQEFTGRVRGNGVQIVRKRAYAHSRGGYSPVFYAAVLPVQDSSGARSQLIGHFQLHPISRLFIVVWLGLSTLLALAFLVLGLVQGGPESTWKDALPYLAPGVLPLLGLLFAAWQGRRGEPDREAIRSWLQTQIPIVD